MKTLNYKEIYYTSSECSIINHSAGIGVRTHSEGMDSNEAVSIAEKCVFGYSVDDKRTLSFEQIQANPKVVYDYAPTYMFQKLTLDNGAVKYVFGRTVYIGIDYGYFCNRNQAMRTGTNYFTHLLVFDEMPPVTVWLEFEKQGVFAPVDYTCSPDNNELTALMTGNPTLLAPKSIECAEDGECTLNKEFAYCVMALLQSYYNAANNKDESLRKILIKAPAAMTAELISKIAVLPQALVADKTFVSNYMQGYGVPDDFNVAFVNEYNTNEIYESNHICIDFFNASTTNVDENYLYKKVLELTEEGDLATIKKLINYYMTLDLTQELNYEFMYNLFIAVESDRDVVLQEVSQDFVRQLSGVKLSNAQETRLWEKVNLAINGGLTSTKGAMIHQAIAAVGYLLPEYKHKLNVSQESRKWITNILFCENSYLSKIVTANNVETVIWLLDRTLIASDEAFYKSLKQSQDALVWTKMLGFYYSNNLILNIDSIIENILTSDLQKKDGLVKFLYPVDKCRNELLSYILGHANRIPELKEIVKDICLSSRDERFSLILQHCKNDTNVVRILAPVVVEYYGKLIDEEYNSGMRSLLSLVEKISVEVFNLMDAAELFDKYIDHCMENPVEDDKDVIYSLLHSNIRMNGTTSDKILVLNNLFNNETPQKVDMKILLLAHKMDKDIDYIKGVYEAWLKTQPTASDIRNYVKSATNLSSGVIEELVLSTWNSRIRVIRDQRDEYVLIISDNSGWKSKDKKAFIKSCKEKDLALHLMESEKITKKIIRKILNLLK